MKHLPVLAFVAAVLATPAYAAGAKLHTCMQKHDADNSDFIAKPIRVPAGVVFELVGPAFGDATDPEDAAHSDSVGKWVGLSKAEEERRDAIRTKYLHDDQAKPELVTLTEVRLTTKQPCADVPVAAILSKSWRWIVAPVFGGSDSFFQVYGVVRGGEVDTGFENDRDSLDHAVSRGQIHGILSGTTDRVITIP